jgi:glycosyltransferase involved in cell wall biosynthesis
MSNFWKNVDVLIVPSITENFPTVIAEAAYRAIPVIATNVGGIPEMITHGENGLLIEATVNSIASGIKVFLDLPNYERNRLGKNNLEYFHKTFDRTKLLNSYTKTYAEVIAGNAS